MRRLCLIALLVVVGCVNFDAVHDQACLARPELCDAGVAGGGSAAGGGGGLAVGGGSAAGGGGGGGLAVGGGAAFGGGEASGGGGASTDGGSSGGGSAGGGSSTGGGSAGNGWLDGGPFFLDGGPQMGLCLSGACWLNPTPAGDFTSVALLPDGGVHAVSLNTDVRFDAFGARPVGPARALLTVNDEVWLFKDLNVQAFSTTLRSIAAPPVSAGRVAVSSTGMVWFESSGTPYLYAGLGWGPVIMPSPCNRANAQFAAIGTTAVIGCDIVGMTTTLFEVGPMMQPRPIGTLLNIGAVLGPSPDLILALATNPSQSTFVRLDGGTSGTMAPSASATVASDHSLLGLANPLTRFEPDSGKWVQLESYPTGAVVDSFGGVRLIGTGSSLTLNAGSSVAALTLNRLALQEGRLFRTGLGSVGLAHGALRYDLSIDGLTRPFTAPATPAPPSTFRVDELPDGRLAALTPSALYVGGAVALQSHRAQKLVVLSDGRIATTRDVLMPQRLTVYDPRDGGLLYADVPAYVDGGFSPSGWLDISKNTSDEVLLMSSDSFVRVAMPGFVVNQISVPPEPMRELCRTDGGASWLAAGNTVYSRVSAAWQPTINNVNARLLDCTDELVAWSDQGLWVYTVADGGLRQVPFVANQIKIDTKGTTWATGTQGQVISVPP